MTVMSGGTSEGVQGRCDARGHTAIPPHGPCMCGGRDHGSVAHGTFEEVHAQHAEEILSAAEQRAAADGRILIRGGRWTWRPVMRPLWTSPVPRERREAR